jgi:K(+)-stimulated pyrophosphate-energized sodium pump
VSEAKVVLPPFSARELVLLWGVLGSALLALAYGWFLRRRVLSRDPGPEAMVAVARAIQEGAYAYLSRQARTMAWFVVVLAVALYALYAPLYRDRPALAVGVAVAFLLGCLASHGAGYVGMTSAVQGNVRVASAARRSFKEALEVAFQAGTTRGCSPWAWGCWERCSSSCSSGSTPCGFWWGSGSAAPWWRRSCGWAEESTPRPRT